jgi:hypothetical protein
MSAAVNIHLRSSLVAQEPLKVRTPVHGLFSGLLPPDPGSTLADALALLIEAIESGLITGLTVKELRRAIAICHNNGVDVKQFQEAGNPSNLTVAGIAAINLYTGEFVPPQFYSVLNTALRDADRAKCKPFVPYIWLLMHALRDCPQYSQTVVFRGVKADLSSAYQQGRKVTWFQFSSCTCNISVEQSDLFCGSSGVRTLFTIELTTGRARLITQYSMVPSEAEVLLPPNSFFEVKGVFNAGNGLIQIHLQELPCLDPILDFDDTSSGGVAIGGGGGGAVAIGGGEDPEILELSQTLKALGVGLAADCLDFARKLTKVGVLSLDRLKKLPEAHAREVLESCGLKKLQVLTILEAVAPVSPAPSPAPAPPKVAPVSASAASAAAADPKASFPPEVPPAPAPMLHSGMSAPSAGGGGGSAASFIKMFEEKAQAASTAPAAVVSPKSLLPVPFKSPTCVAKNLASLVWCGHYKSRCKIIAKCCGQEFGCRFCHDTQVGSHNMNRYDVEEVVCNRCQMRQPISNSCRNEKCGIKDIPFAKYYCDICHLYSDSHLSEIYHCDKCRICRICSLGNTKKDYFHCDICGGCIVKDLKDTHKCIPDALKGDCSICSESIFLSKVPVRLLPCGHAVHAKCLEDSLKSNRTSCPLCRKSMVDGEAK